MIRLTLPVACLATLLCISIDSYAQPAAPEPVIDSGAPLLTELQDIRRELKGREEAQQTILAWVQVLAATVIGAALIAFVLQIGTMFADATNRRRNAEERAEQYKHEHEARAVQSGREAEFHSKFLKVLDVATKSAEEAQQKVSKLEEGGIKRAGHTLQLINNLLEITERAAAKAAGAQFDFLSRTIDSLESECTELISTSTKEDDRDIIAKSAFSEQVRVLTDQIKSLDYQISSYNESTPPHFEFPQQAGEVSPAGRAELRRTRLALPAPCLFIRGQNHLQHQNFVSAINDWKLSLSAKNNDPVKVYANYWIGYLYNTIGEFDSSPEFFKAAAEAAAEEKEPELLRLELETRLFALDYSPVPDDILHDGEAIYARLPLHRIPGRTLSSFATTMGNMALIRDLRATVADQRPFNPEMCTTWFSRAEEAVERSRWARFGKCQSAILAGGELEDVERRDLEYVLGSVRREYQARIEDRSKVLSRITEYICMVLLGDQKEQRLSTVAASVENHAGLVRARTIYSQFRKQNVDKYVFLHEFNHFIETRDLATTCRMANTKPAAKHS